jgi:hypothetical protein
MLNRHLSRLCLNNSFRVAVDAVNSVTTGTDAKPLTSFAVIVFPYPYDVNSTPLFNTRCEAYKEGKGVTVFVVVLVRSQTAI